MAVKASTSADNLMSPIKNRGFQEFVVFIAPKYKNPCDLQRLSLKKGNLPQVYQIRIMQTLNDLRLAVLIDADNIPYSNVKGMLEEIAKYGTPTFKRIYGDWTKPTVSGWKSVLLENAITPVQQYSYTQGKNATDSAMIIDAMDILYSGKVDGFCLVSSDSDFTTAGNKVKGSRDESNRNR